MSRSSAPDTPADVSLRELLDEESRRGFVMVAGAGSGKTTSLVKAIDHVVTKHGDRLRARTQQAACITYTEVAAREIHRDVGNSPLVVVSTIHSFLWSLAKPFQKDIRRWVTQRLEEKIQEVNDKQEGYSSRTRTTTREKDDAYLAKLREQLMIIPTVERFSYGTGSDYAKGILGHDDVIRMVPELIIGSSLFPRIVAGKHPYIFVDESQDTFPAVVNALKHVSTQAPGALCLGFFGDPMQQIYQSGVGTITLDTDWIQIDKPENFRSSGKVLRVINHIRAEADGLIQVPGRSRDACGQGEFFFFVLPADDRRTEHLELVRTWLGRHSGAGGWTSDAADDGTGVKILMIAHRMVAKRMGFESLYSVFHDGGSQSLKSAFDEGDAWPLRPFANVILPICSAGEVDSQSVIMTLRTNGGSVFSDASTSDFRKILSQARDSVTRMRELFELGGRGSVRKVLETAIDGRLIAEDPRWSAYFSSSDSLAQTVISERTLKVLDSFMSCDVREISRYFQYFMQQSPYSTQHGTKGSEFSRVIVVIDDDEGRYSLYSYNKLFGLKNLSPTDKKNIREGKETVLERTRRLLYVCASRAVDSLAVVVFASPVSEARAAIAQTGITGGEPVLGLEDLRI